MPELSLLIHPCLLVPHPQVSEEVNQELRDSGESRVPQLEPDIHNGRGGGIKSYLFPRPPPLSPGLPPIRSWCVPFLAPSSMFQKCPCPWGSWLCFPFRSVLLQGQLPPFLPEQVGHGFSPGCTLELLGE